jgi:multidrug resistance efflux pump
VPTTLDQCRGSKRLRAGLVGGFIDHAGSIMTDPSAPVSPTAKTSRAAAVIVALTIAIIVGLSLWYLVQPQPLLVQGEADATRIDIAARVDGRVAKRPVERGDTVSAGQVLV